MNLDALGLEGGHEPIVLLPDTREIGRLVALPVPALLGIEESPNRRVPALRTDPLQLCTRAAHQD